MVAQTPKVLHDVINKNWGFLGVVYECGLHSIVIVFQNGLINSILTNPIVKGEKCENEFTELATNNSLYFS